MMKSQGARLFKVGEMMDMTPALSALSDAATEAHTKIQQNFKDLNPVVGVNQGMRRQGIPADVMTIDCLKSAKRIVIILHDDEPDIVRYQFAHKDQDPGDVFELLPAGEMNASQLYDWMRTYLPAV